MRRKLILTFGACIVGALAVGLGMTNSAAQEEEKKEEKPIEVTTGAKVAWADVPGPVKTAVAKETGSNYTWSKGTTSDKKEVYVVTFKRYARTAKLVVTPEGKVILREDTTAAVEEKGAAKGKADEKTAPVPVAKGGPTYVKDIKAILNANCKQCHDIAKRKADLDLISSYNTVMEAVKPGNPGGSIMYLAMTGNGAKRMPPDKRLDPAEIAVVKAWIAAGAKEK